VVVSYREVKPDVHAGTRRSLIQSLQAEGHPITVGSTGENLTLAGVDWRVMAPGVEVQGGATRLGRNRRHDYCRLRFTVFEYGRFPGVTSARSNTRGADAKGLRQSLRF